MSQGSDLSSLRFGFPPAFRGKIPHSHDLDFGQHEGRRMVAIHRPAARSRRDPPQGGLVRQARLRQVEDREKVPLRECIDGAEVDARYRCESGRE